MHDHRCVQQYFIMSLHSTIVCITTIYVGSAKLPGGVII